MELNGVYGRDVIERGRGYADNVRYCMKLRWFLHAEVEGTNVYKTKVNLKTLEGDCSCPYGSNCKHAVAAYLEYKKGNYVNADAFAENLKTLSREELIKIIVDELPRNPDIALNHQLRKTTKPESFVNGFINDFSYEKLQKAERLLPTFTFEQLLRMSDYLTENEEDVFDKIYEDYGIADEGEVLYDFQSALDEEIIKKISGEKELKQALKYDRLREGIAEHAENFAGYKGELKAALPKEKFLEFLLNLENPDLDEIEKAITPKNREALYYLPIRNPALAEEIATRLKDKRLLLVAAVYEGNYAKIMENLAEYDGVMAINEYLLEDKLPDLVDLFIKNKFHDKKLARKLLTNEFLELYDEKQLDYLLSQVDEYKFVKKLVDFREEFTRTKPLLERLFELDGNETRKLIDSQKDIFGHKHLTEAVDILKYLLSRLGREYVISLIKANADHFRTASALKNSLKNEGIFISNREGRLNVDVER